jgi:uncharacterized protein (DUF885 family)
MHQSEPFPHFVDDYLAYLYEVLPSQASLDGVHLHDDLLEDLSRHALEGHVRALAGFARRLQQIDTAFLTPAEQIDHRILAGNVDSRMHEFDVVRAWERNPQFYAATVGASLAGQTLFDYAPEPDRARRIVSKLRQVPRVVDAARDNIKEAPGIFVKVGLEAWRGVHAFIDHELPRAFSALDDLHILSDLADASTEASASVAAFIAYLESDLAPRAKASFRVGRERFEQQLRLDERVSLNADRLLTIALRELQEVQEEFRVVAARLGDAEPADVWRAVKADHPAAGTVAAAARAQLEELQTFLERSGLITGLPTAQVVVASSPELCRGLAASLWAPGPFEAKPGRAVYFVTDVQKGWPAPRQEEHLRDTSTALLWSQTMHHVAPGHLALGHLVRQVESKARKSRLFASACFVDGWAHYGEHVMCEAGFRRSDAALRLGQLAEAMARLARLVVSIRLHCEDQSVEQGMRFFRDEAFLEEATARREAERGTFDPSYFSAALGKVMLLKLRRDFKENQGSKYSLRAFHDAVLANGSAPFWAHRRFLLNETSDAALE